MLKQISKEERWPVYAIEDDEDGDWTLGCDIPEELHNRVLWVSALYWSINRELGAIYEKRREQIQHEVGKK